MVIVSSAWQVMGGTGAYTHYLTSYRNAYINVSLFRSGQYFIEHKYIYSFFSIPLATLIVQLHYFMEKPVSDVLRLDCTVVCPTLYSLGLT